MKKEFQAGTNDEQRTGADISTSDSVEANPMLSAAFSVVEGNKLIAKFDGGILNEYELQYPVFDFKDKDGNAGGCFYFNELKYNSSWDWLIPVIQKIRSTGAMVNINFYDEIKTIECVIYTWEIGSEEIRIENENGIEPIWLAVIDFIKWYNTTVGSR